MLAQLPALVRDRGTAGAWEALAGVRELLAGVLLTGAALGAAGYLLRIVLDSLDCR